jgi:hypothetical protein
MLDIQHILRKLPHRYPILLVDRVIELEKNVQHPRAQERHHQRALLPRALSGAAGDARCADARSAGAGRRAAVV